jgi:hypothetical protein
VAIRIQVEIRVRAEFDENTGLGGMKVSNKQLVIANIYRHLFRGG